MIRRKTNRFESYRLMLERRVAKLEEILDSSNAQYAYKIHSTMTDDNFYFISDDELSESLIREILDLFFKSMNHDDYDSDECDAIFDELMQLCDANGIEYQYDINESTDLDENTIVIEIASARF